MGIFKEDLINLGNLIDTEVEVKLYPEDFRRVFPDLEFEFTDGLLKIRGKKKTLIFSRTFEFRGREDPGAVRTVKDHETKDLIVEVHVVSKDGIDKLSETGKFSYEGDRIGISVLPVLKETEVYSKIPDTFRERLKITRYRIRDGYMSVFITVTK